MPRTQRTRIREDGVSNVVRVGTRGSNLALRQAELVADALRRHSPGTQFTIEVLRSGGDRQADTPLAVLGRGIFVKELEEALLEGRVDLAVHSLKDLPTDEVPGLTVVLVLERADPRDALVDRWDAPLAELPAGARIGTSSPRREAQLRALRPDLAFSPIRGNVETRLAKAAGPDYDATVVAVAGLVRLGLQHRAAEYLEPDVCAPDPGQGALAVELRVGDAGLLAMVRKLEHRATALAVTAERELLRASGGGCQTPLGALATVHGDSLQLLAAASALDGSMVCRISIERPVADPEAAGRAAYQALLDQGAAPLFGVGAES